MSSTKTKVKLETKSSYQITQNDFSITKNGYKWGTDELLPRFK